MEVDYSGFTLTKISKKKYKVTGNNCPADMEITVKKESWGYRAECNYSLNVKGLDHPYQAMHLCPTAEKTLTHLLLSLKPVVGSSWEKLKTY
jgi:hypothetical protein